LSDNNVGSINIDTGALFGASTIYVPYRTIEDTPVAEWPGTSLKVLFNEVIPTDPDPSIGWPGLWNGDVLSADYNPLGWYSYKIVVKQTEQDYYNVYLPGLVAGNPLAPLLELGKTSYMVLINDNINKVPRDLSEIGPAQLQFRSSVTLFSRVNNVVSEGISPTANQQYYPGNTFSFVNTIATNNSLFGVDTALPLDPDFYKFYDVTSNPLIARITTEGIIGSPDLTEPYALAVMETEGVDSRLDIFWETTSVGIISELNILILEGTQGARSIENFIYTHKEDMVPGTQITTQFYPVDIDGLPIASSDMTMTVKNLIGTTRTTEFELVKVGAGILPYDSYYIKTATTPDAYFYYGPGAAYNESYNFRFNITAESLNTVVTRSGSLSNEFPSIDPDNPTDIINKMSGDVDVAQFYATNGSLEPGGKWTYDITWAVASQFFIPNVGPAQPTTLFSITNNPINVGPLKRGLLKQLSGTADGKYIVIVSATDAGGLTVYREVEINYGVV